MITLVGESVHGKINAGAALDFPWPERAAHEGT